MCMMSMTNSSTSVWKVCICSTDAPSGENWEIKQFRVIKIIKHGRFNERWSYCPWWAGKYFIHLLMWHVFMIIFCWTWWPSGNFPLLVVNDSISNSVAPLILVTKQIVAPSGGILALQHLDACGTQSMVRIEDLFAFRVKKQSAI